MPALRFAVAPVLVVTLTACASASFISTSPTPSIATHDVGRTFRVAAPAGWTELIPPPLPNEIHGWSSPAGDAGLSVFGEPSAELSANGFLDSIRSDCPAARDQAVTVAGVAGTLLSCTTVDSSGGQHVENRAVAFAYRGFDYGVLLASVPGGTSNEVAFDQLVASWSWR
jgi:hypothetical protein